MQKSKAEAAIDKEEARVDETKAAKPELPGIGHNAKEFPSRGDADKRLRSFIERVERLEAEKAELAVDIKGIYGEAKANGYQPTIMRKIVRMRAMDGEKRQEEEALIEVYKNAVGMD